MQVYTCIVSICRKVVKRVYLITLRQLIAKPEFVGPDETGKSGSCAANCVKSSLNIPAFSTFIRHALHRPVLPVQKIVHMLCYEQLCISCHDEVKRLILKREINTVIVYERQILYSFLIHSGSIGLKRVAYYIQPDHFTVRIILCHRECQISASTSRIYQDVIIHYLVLSKGFAVLFAQNVKGVNVGAP